MSRSDRDAADSLAKIEAGMRVVDAIEEEIGTVQQVDTGGFMKIDGSWVFGQPVYATPDQISGVSGDTVRLAATKRELWMRDET